MNKFSIIIFCFIFLASCQNIQNVEKTEKKNMTKEFTISIEPNLKTKKLKYFQQLISKIKSA